MCAASPGAAGAEEVHLRELERAAKLLKEQLETEFDEISGGAGARASKGDARRRAHHPARPGAQIPSFPKKLPITLFATLGTLILSVGAVISGELLSGKARPAAPAPSGPKAEAKAPAAAASAPPGAEQTSEDAELTRAAEAEEAEDAGASKSAEPLAETQTAPSQVDPPRREAACVKVLVALCGADASSDEAAIALGRNLARRGRALLIAADSGAEGFEAFAPEQESEPKGLADLLTVETAFADAIHRDASSRLHVMTAGVGAGEERYDLEPVIDALAHTYDFLVFAASREQALRLAPLVDMAFVIGGDEAEALRDELASAGTDAYLLEDGVNADDLVAAE